MLKKLVKGYSDNDIYYLNETIANFVVPRLKKFREDNVGRPSSLSLKEWNDRLDLMVFAFDYYQKLFRGELRIEKIEGGKSKAGLGMIMFGKYFKELYL